MKTDVALVSSKLDTPESLQRQLISQSNARVAALQRSAVSLLDFGAKKASRAPLAASQSSSELINCEKTARTMSGHLVRGKLFCLILTRCVVRDRGSLNVLFNAVIALQFAIDA